MAKAFGAGIIQLQEKCEVCGLLVNSPVGIIHSEQGKIVSSIVYLNDADLTGFATHCKHRTVDATSRFPSCEVLTARIAEKWAFRSVPTPSRPSPRARLDLQSMLHAFQSIGDNCEYGFVQRWAGAEPLDLLRFAGFAARPEHRLQLTIAALEAGFEGLGAEGSVTCELQGSNQQREFIVRENRWNLSLHTGKHEGEVDPLALPREQQRVLSFKRRELLEDLRTAHRPFLWKADSGNAEGEIRQLVQCLRAYGPNLLLWVRLSDAEHSAEMVEYAGEGLLIGYASRFAPYEAVEEIDLASWHTLIPRAWRASGLLRLLGEWGGDHRKPEPPLAEVDISDTADATAEFEPAGQVGETGPVSIGLSFRDDAARAWMQERPSSVSISTFRISNALLDSACAILIKDGHKIKETRYLLDNEDYTKMMPHLRGLQFFGRRMAVLGFNRPYRNYYHWMTQCLPAIESSLKMVQGDEAILILPKLAAWQEQTLQWLGLGQVPRVTIDFKRHYAFEEIVYCDILNGKAAFSLSPLAVSSLQRLAYVIPQAGASHKRLYVSRGDSHQRLLRNERELEALMQDAGFQVVIPGEFSVAQQVELFRKAEVVVGPHGAGLTNIAFCRPGTTVLELMQSSFVNPCFNRIAQTCRLNYHAECFESRSGPDPHRQDWSIDLDRIWHMLAAVGITPH